MPTDKQEEIKSSLESIFEGVERLRNAFDNRRFTIDGRLVGDIGEVLASLYYDVTLDPISKPIHDGITSGNRGVQVKATFQDSLTFKGGYDLYLGIRVNKDGSFNEIYNGPGSLIEEAFSHRKGIGEHLISLSCRQLRVLNENVGEGERVAMRPR